MVLSENFWLFVRLPELVPFLPKYFAMPHPLWEIPSEDITRTVAGMNCRRRGWFLPLPLLPRPISLQVAGRSGGNWYKPTLSMSIMVSAFYAFFDLCGSAQTVS